MSIGGCIGECRAYKEEALWDAEDGRLGAEQPSDCGEAPAGFTARNCSMFTAFASPNI